MKETQFTCGISCSYLAGVPTAVGTPVKYECDLKDLTGAIPKPRDVANGEITYVSQVPPTSS